MTRFARAKGSKASNEKLPEDGTPWEVMKQQLLNAKKENEEAKQREEVEKKRIENYQKFLNEHKTQKRQATWCDFPDAVKSKKPSVNKSEESANKMRKKQNKLHDNKQSNTTVDIGSTNELEPIDNTCKKNKKSFKDQPSSQVDLTPIAPEEQTFKKKKKKKGSNKVDSGNEIVEEEILNVQEKKVSKKKHKNEIELTVHGDQKSEPLNNVVDKHDENSVDKIKKKKKKSKVPPINTDTNNSDDLINNKLNKPAVANNQETHSQNSQTNRKKKFNDKSKATRRKPVNDNSFQLIINGKDVDLVRFDGFPIMKKDAERINDLKQNMVRKGIPKSEVQRTIKLERRRAEKALARLKRDVCYNCRKGGHNLSDCPELKSKIPGAEAPDGICFKCGSTEHRQFECKVQRDKEFRFATCFICKESGHIARQCPDNPKGLYPNGGCCKLCGDVTHLRKDCPTVNEQKEASSIKLPTLDSAEDIEEIGQKANLVAENKVKKPKKVSF